MDGLDSSSNIFTNIFKYILTFLEFNPWFSRLEHSFQSHDLVQNLPWLEIKLGGGWGNGKCFPKLFTVMLIVIV